MFLMWIVPLVIIGLAVYVISGNNFANALRPLAGRTCLRCQQAVQRDWKVCPHCGQTL